MATLKKLRLSLIHPFYNDRPRLKVHTVAWKGYSKEALEAIDFVLVDDCSSKKELAIWCDFNRIKVPYIAIFRIMDDLKWNTPGALNLGVLQSTTDWVLFMDSDCLMLPEDVERLINFEPDPNTTYFFPRNRICTDERIRNAKADRFLPCAILIHKDLFIRAGGFDEDFTGARSGGYAHFDNDFVTRVLEIGERRIMDGTAGNNGRHRVPEDTKVQPRVVIQEYMEDVVGSNVQTITGTTEKNILINKRLWYAKIRGEVPRNREHLRFNWKCRFDRRKRRKT